MDALTFGAVVLLCLLRPSFRQKLPFHLSETQCLHRTVDGQERAPFRAYDASDCRNSFDLSDSNPNRSASGTHPRDNDARTVIAFGPANSVRDAEAASSLKAFHQVLARADESFLIAVGENDQGMFRFEDGSEAPIQQLADDVAAFHKAVVIVTGSARRYFRKQDIWRPSQTKPFYESSKPESIEVAVRVQSLIRKRRGPISLAELVRRLHSELQLVPCHVQLHFRILYLLHRSEQGLETIGIAVVLEQFLP